jgi:intraflagellar transport protein 172
VASETEALWQQLSTLALASAQLSIAERCSAALGDAGKARYLRKVNKLAHAHAKQAEAQGIQVYNLRLTNRRPSDGNILCA